MKEHKFEKQAAPAKMNLLNRFPPNIRSLIIVVACALLGLFWIEQSRDDASVSAGASTAAPFIGYRTPDFALESLDGQRVGIADWAGQPVVINFWATWCGPCRAEMPALMALADANAGAVHVIGINQAESAAVVQAYVAELGIAYPILLDADSSISRLYQVRGLPTTFFIDGDGVIRDLIIGAASNAVMQRKLEALLTTP